jgi:predicted DNA binding CopG/RHH family protein
MKTCYDFSRSVKNPYTKWLKKPVTIRLDVDTVAYFKSLSASQGVPYQNLVNLYLHDCAARRRRLKLTWR